MNGSCPSGPRIFFVAHGDETRASSRLRVYNWLPYLEQLGAECRVIPYFPHMEGSGRLGSLKAAAGRRLRIWRQTHRAMLTAARWADTIVIQEALLPRFLLHAIKRIGKRIVYDFSDPVHMPHPDQSAVRQLLHKVIDFRRFDQTLRSANCCLVENALLAPVADARGCPPMIAPGPIDVRRFPERPPTARQQVNVGWLGSPGTYCQLEPLLPILEEVGKECGNVRLTLLGAGKVQPRLPHVDVEVFPWKLESEPAIMSDFDIAICFLKMTPWTRARGGSKLLAYMAAGAPIISSPAGIGDQVVDPLCGLLADTDEQWKAALLKLIRDSDLRRSMAQASRALAIQKYSYEAMLPTLLKALRLSPAKPLSDASQQAA